MNCKIKLKCGIALNVGHFLAPGHTTELSFAEAREHEQRYGIDLRTSNDDTDTWHAFIQTDEDEPHSFWFTVFDDAFMYEYDVESNNHPLSFGMVVTKRITPLFIHFDQHREFLESLPRKDNSDNPPGGLPDAILLLVGIDSGITNWDNQHADTDPVWYDVQLPRRDSSIVRKNWVGELEVYVVPPHDEE